MSNRSFLTQRVFNTTYAAAIAAIAAAPIPVSPREPFTPWRRCQRLRRECDLALRLGNHALAKAVPLLRISSTIESKCLSTSSSPCWVRTNPALLGLPITLACGHGWSIFQYSTPEGIVREFRYGSTHGSRQFPKCARKGGIVRSIVHAYVDSKIVSMYGWTSVILSRPIILSTTKTPPSRAKEQTVDTSGTKDGLFDACTGRVTVNGCHVASVKIIPKSSMDAWTGCGQIYGSRYFARTIPCIMDNR